MFSLEALLALSTNCQAGSELFVSPAPRAAPATPDTSFESVAPEDDTADGDVVCGDVPASPPSRPCSPWDDAFDAEVAVGHNGDWGGGDDDDDSTARGLGDAIHGHVAAACADVTESGDADLWFGSDEHTVYSGAAGAAGACDADFDDMEDYAGVDVDGNSM